MAILHVRNIPDELYEQLKERARAKGRSISSEVTQILRRELQRSPYSENILEEIRKNRPSLNAPPVEQLIREDRQR